MKIIVDRADKIRLIASTIVLSISLCLMASVEIGHRVSPPPDADIGGGLILLFGLANAIFSGICLVASLLYVLLRNNLRSRRLTCLLTTVITVLVVLIVGLYAYKAANTLFGGV